MAREGKMQDVFERARHVIEQEEGPPIRVQHPSFINQRIWPTISTAITMLFITRFFVNTQKWRNGYDLLFSSLLLAVVWFKVAYPLVMWRWGGMDDLGYGWTEAWDNGVDFISTAVIFIVATTATDITLDEIDVHGFTTVEGIVIMFIGVILLYGGYVYFIRIVEAKYYFVADTRKRDAEKQTEDDDGDFPV